MSLARTRLAALCFATLVAEASLARAEDAGDDRSLLEGHLRLLEQKKLAPAPAQSVDELSVLLEQAQRAVLEGNHDEASTLLLEIVEGPRFRDFDSLPEFHTAELLLASELYDAHALKSAQRVIDHVLAAGPDAPAFGPGYRRAVDIALARGDLDASASHLASLVKGALPEDSANELHYLRARAAYDRDALDEAERELGAISKKSRFYASAQYLLGAIAAKERRFKDAEARFCAITEAEKDDTFSFYVDGRFFPVRDLAHLGLGRVAHETGRPNDAFYYYFQVPNDSDKLAQALFEASWASYEGGDHDAALDSLDQLEARYPRSPYAAEAAVLRGYVHLARCEFAEAEKQLTKFEQTFTPVLREIDQALESPARRASIYRDLVARNDSIERMRAAAEAGDPSPDNMLLALAEADPEFYRLSSEIRSLDAELARTGNTSDELDALAERVKSKDAPAPRLDDTTDDTEALTRELESARSAVDAFAVELRAIARAGAKGEELRSLRETQQTLDRRVAELESKLREVTRSEAVQKARPASSDLTLRLHEDRAYVEELRKNARRVRADLEDAADAAGERTLRDTRERLAQELRRARIGRIDAVMGAKRQVELQVESLAAGRFPAELTDPLRMQSLLRDDEEYWPFEGEDWPDEFVERYPEESR